MTTLATNPNIEPTAVSPDHVALLESQVEVLETAVQTALRQHLFHNQGRLMTPRKLPDASQKITQNYLHYLRYADQEQLVATAQDLAAQGLGHLSALAVVDALYTTSHSLWAEANPQALAVVHTYRTQFLYQYMQAREQITINAREGFYQNVELALERRVQQERELRQELLERSDLLTRERALLTSLLDSIPDLIFYKDVAGTYLGCNTAFAEFTGQSEEELTGKTDFDLFPHDVAASFREQDMEMMAQGQARHNDEWVDYPDGRRVLLDTLKTPFYDADKNLLGLIGISRNITAAYQAQEEIRRLGYVVEQSLDGTAIADLDGIIQFVNPAWAAMHGYTQDELLGQHLSIFHTPEQLTEEVEPTNQQAIISGQPQRNEIGHVRKDGSTFPTMMTIGLLKDKDGNPIGLTASVQDITERKAAETRLRESQERLSQANQVVENSPAILFRWRADEHWTVEYVSENVSRFGYTQEELLTGRTLYASLVHPDDLQRVGQEVAEYSASGVEQFTQEYRIVTKDGEVRWTDDRTLIVRNKAGEITHYQGIVIDISERKAAEQALRESENRYRQILDAITQMVLVKGEKSSIIWANKAFRDYYDMDNEALQGLIDASFNEPDHTQQYVRDDAYVFDTGQVLEVPEEPVTRYDGQVRLFHTVKSPIFDETGEVIATVGVSEDITARKAAENILRENQARLAEAARIAKLHYWEFDIATQQFTFLPEYYELLGTTAEEEGGYTMSAADYTRKFVPAEEASIVEKEVVAALMSTDPNYYREFDSFNVTKDGRVFPIRVRFRAIKDENGQTIKTIGANQDITEQVEAARVLRESEERFRNILENANEIIYTLSVDGVFQYVSPAWTELVGHPVAEVEGHPFAPFVHPDDVPVCVAFLQDIVITGQSQRGAEYRVRHKDGSWRWHSSNGSAVKDEAGNVLYYVGLAQDVTEQKAAEAALAKRARELRAVSEVGTAVATTLEPDTLLQEIVNLTKSRFNLYHAHIYLLDETGATLNLAAGAGDVGQQMVAQGWQIPLSSEQSLVARVARGRLGATANDVRAEPDFLPNPLLPETRAELAVPIIVGDNLLGVLDVQADTVGYFGEEDVLIQTTLANQIGVAMQNARSFAQSEAARQDLSQLTRRLTREGWQSYLEQQKQPEVRVAVGEAPQNGRALTQSLVVQGEEIGRLALTEPQNFTDEAAEIITAVAERLSSHIENLRLTEQTQIALAETAEQAERLTLLNQIAQVISQTLDPSEMLEAVHQQLNNVLDIDTFHIGLYDADKNTVHYPVLYERGERQPGTTLPLYPDSNSYKVLQTGEALLRHLTAEEVARLKAEQSHILFGEIDEVTASLLFAPLRVGQHILGIISAQSYEPNAYGEDDLQLLIGIAGYVAVALENANLFARTRQRATTLQTLAEIETALSLAKTEDEILGAIINHLPREGLATASLSYFHKEDEAVLDGDSLLSLSSIWTFGAFMPEIVNQFQSLRLDDFATSELWRENAYAPTLVKDILADDRTTPRIVEEANRLGGWRSIVQMPLRSGGRWQGMITFNWLEPQEFSEDDEFLFNRLMEPVGAVIASRRAQLAQQEALSETEMLYTAGAALNAAQTYDDILDVVRQYTIADRAQVVSLNLFDRVWLPDKMPDWIEVVAFFTRRTDFSLPNRFPLKYFPSAGALLNPDRPTVVEDIEDPALEVDDNARALYIHQFQTKSTIFVPLVVAGQWIGYINVLYEMPRQFSEVDIRRLIALSAQAAVAIQNVVSVAETRERAEELAILNEMSRALATLLDPSEIIESIYHFTGQLLDTTNFYVALHDEKNDEISFPYAVENGKRVRWLSRPFGQGMTEYLVQSRQPLLVESDLQRWIEQQEGMASIGSEASSWLGVPMISGNRAIGVIVVQSANDHQFNANHLSLLSAIGSQTTIALQNARLFQQTQARAQREQILREITARVRSSADVETIMKTAVQEIGHTLGRKAMIYLGDQHGA